MAWAVPPGCKPVDSPVGPVVRRRFVLAAAPAAAAFPETLRTRLELVVRERVGLAAVGLVGIAPVRSVLAAAPARSPPIASADPVASRLVRLPRDCGRWHAGASPCSRRRPLAPAG